MTTVALHRTQLDFLKCNEPFAAYVGGIGSGKSFILCYDLIRRARAGGLYMVVAPTYPMLRDATLRTFSDLTRRLGVAVSFQKTEHRAVFMRTGAEVLFRSADNPETLRGPNLSGLAMDEASLMPKDVYDVAIGRLRQGHEVGFLRAAFTPKGPTHWTYETFATGKPDTALFRSRTADNPFLPEAFEATVARQYGETSFARQELGGEFVQTEGAEFSAEWFDHPAFWFSEWPNLVAKVVYVDPSRGLRDKSHDDQAFVMAGLTRDGVIHADCVVAREPVPQMVARTIDLCRRWWPVDSLVLEDNGTMGFLGPEMERQTREAKLVLPWQLVTNTDPKAFRIRGLATYLSRGQVRLRDTAGGRALRNQLADWPLAEHDDCVDALSGAVRRLEQLAAGMGGG